MVQILAAEDSSSLIRQGFRIKKVKRKNSFSKYIVQKGFRFAGKRLWVRKKCCFTLDEARDYLSRV